jgi:hypothetical protein
MRYNIYNLTEDFNIVKGLSNDLDDSIKDRLDIIQNQITLEYLKKQEGKLGIKNLGNEIRFNKILKNEFNILKDNKIIVKMTENRRSFIKVFIDNWINNNTSEIYYFILEDGFGNTSNIVDGSFIRINEIKEELLSFYNYFQKITFGPKISFIEVKEFNKYHLIDNEGYTRIQLNK